LLHLKHNIITETGGTALADALKVNTGARALHLQENGIGDAGSTALVAAMNANTAVTYLNLKSNCISDLNIVAGHGFVRYEGYEQQCV
jgi:hypothetical protein